MLLRNSKENFSTLLKFFHWLLACCIVFQFASIYYRRFLPNADPDRLFWILNHKSVGISIFCIALGLLIARSIGPHPTLERMPLYERILARLTQAVLYALVLIMPLSGYLMAAFNGKAVAVWGWTLPIWVDTDAAMADLSYTAHVIQSTVLWMAVALHVLGALKHHFWDRNSVLRRMGFGPFR